MNSLSWTIYWIETLGGVKIFLVASAVLLPVAVFVHFVIRAMIEDGHSDPEGRLIAARDRAWWWVFPSLLTGLVVLFVLQFVPGRQTLILMAASQIGERVIQTEDAQNGIELLRTWIRSETERLSEKRH